MLWGRFAGLVLALGLLGGAGAAAAQPALPEGLGAPPSESSDPALPKGLGQGSGEAPAASGPALPEGLGEAPAGTTPPEDAEAGPGFFDNVTGFIEARGGVRIDEDPYEDRASLGEARLQLDGLWQTESATFQLTTDFIADALAEDQSIDLETGNGFIDLRQANVLVRPADNVDLKVGRQILTWGVGDLVFINDLFPKDFRSFFLGRDVEYLKAPSDAARLSVFFDLINSDLVYTPRFDPDRYVNGERLSYYNPVLGRIAGQDAIIEPETPDAWFSDDEIALRLYRNIGAYELAGYFYDGFWKSPVGLTPDGRFTFPALSVYGASARGPLLGGIGSAEVGYYDSRDDRGGDDPLIPNSQWKGLVGFEREVLPNFTAGGQYVIEHTPDFEPGVASGDQNRHLITLRLTKLALNQNLELSAFNFWSPNEDDGHLRLRASYKASDAWLIEGGTNLFYGPDETAPFSSLEYNSNVFLALRRSF